MKFLTLAAAVLVGSLALVGPAEARGRHDDRGHNNGWNSGHGNHNAKRHHKRHCKTVWRHHRKVRVCR